MTRIHRIDSSSLPISGGSHSKELADKFIACLQAQSSGAEIITRDLADTALSHISNDTVMGFYTPPEHITNGLREPRASFDVSAELFGNARDYELQS